MLFKHINRKSKVLENQHPCLFFFIRRNKLIPLIVLIFSLSLFLLTAARANQDKTSAITQKITHLIDHGGYIVARDNQTIAQHKADIPFIPASIWKITTAAAALHILGPDYRFQTRFYQNNEGDLYIQGTGDPFLVSEEITQIMNSLQNINLQPIRNLIFDITAFKLDTAVDGSSGSKNPYDACNGALVVNFNTVHIHTHENGLISSAEKQTPKLPIMQELAGDLPQGKHRIALSNDPSKTIAYAGQLFKSLSTIAWANDNYQVLQNKVPKDLHPVYIHHSSKKLTTVLEALFLYSNNFIANQLFLSCGAKRFGYPATWEKGQKAIRDYLRSELKLPVSSFQVAEGSGLSRKNVITPQAMISILNSFRPFASLLAQDSGRLIKSGTLNGVYSYAGYFMQQNQSYPFVLILNQKKNTRDRILDLLEQMAWER